MANNLITTGKAAGVAIMTQPNTLFTAVLFLGFLILLSFMAAGLAHFLQMTFQKGMIFRKYKAWLTYWFDFKPREKRGSYYRVQWVYKGMVQQFRDKRQYKTELREAWQGKEPYKKRTVTLIHRPARWYSWFYKPLGGCVYCNGVWLATVVYLPIWYDFIATAAAGLFFWVLYIGANYVFIELIEYLKSKNSK